MNDTQTAVTTYVYDYAGRLVKQTNPDKGILATAYNGNGTVYSETDARDNTIYYQYDGLNRLSQQWTSFADGKYTYQAFTYDKNGNQITSAISTEDVSLWGIPEEVLATTYSYDSCERQVSVEDPADGSIQYEYDADGNVVKETVALDALRNSVTEYEYNHLGKVSLMKQQVSGSVQTTTYEYDAEGNLLTTTDWLGNTTVNTYDTTDRLTSTTDPYGHVIVKNIYDDAGNTMTTYDALGNKTINKYDKRGRLICIIDPLGNTTNNTYDNAGNTITETEGNENTTPMPMTGKTDL